VLHETLLDEAIWVDFAPESAPTPGSNWIAQHPPLYHVVMVPFYWVGALFGTSFWGSFYLIRIVTSLIFGFGIYILMKALCESGLSARVALGLGIMVASVPNHTYLAGAVNHDALVFLFGCLVLLYWIRFTQSGSDSDLFKLGLALGFGGLVKYTFLVLYPPLICLAVVAMWAGKGFCLKRFARFLLPVFVPIGIWMVRNLILSGDPLPLDTTGFYSDDPLEMSFLEFGRTFPVFSILLQTYWGLLGWMGDGTLEVRWLQIYSIYQQAFTWPIFLLLLLTLCYLLKESIGDRKRLVLGLVWALICILLLIVSGWLSLEHSHYIPLFIVGVGVIGYSFGEFTFCWSSKKLDAKRALEMGSMGVFLCFLSVHFYKIFSFSITSGALQGTFGRYYLPVIGFFMVGFFSRGLRQFPLASQLVMIFAMIYSSTELYVWLHEAIPFFNVHG